MKVILGADHRGFDLKEKLKEFLKSTHQEVEDVGAFEYDAMDDYPDFAAKVAHKVLENNNYLGVLICGGGGVEITVNRFKGIRCVLGFDENQVKHVRENDHANVLALPAEYISFDQAKKFVEIFINSKEKQEEKYLRRVRENDEVS